jgi:hypothetical protein
MDDDWGYPYFRKPPYDDFPGDSSINTWDFFGDILEYNSIYTKWGPPVM